MITLKQHDITCVINPHGARIVLLQFGQAVVLDTYTRGDGKQANTHPCTPVFGPDPTYGLGQHGPMRNDECDIESRSDLELVLRYQVEAGTYPKGLVVRQIFRLTDQGLELETVHENTGTEPMPVNFCEHFYWNAPRGWHGVKLNDQDVTSVVKADAAIPILAENRIKIPGQPTITLKQEGLPMANLWSMQHADGQSYDQNYVCIEPCQADPKSNYPGSSMSFLPVGKKLITAISISLSS